MNSDKITEGINKNSTDIHTKNIAEMLQIFNSEDSKIIESVNNVSHDLESFIKNNFNFRALNWLHCVTPYEYVICLNRIVSLDCK